MIEVTLKFENLQTADSFVSWMQAFGAERFFYESGLANSLDIEGRTLFLTSQEKPERQLSFSSSDLVGVETELNDVPKTQSVLVNGEEVSERKSTTLGVGDSNQIKTTGIEQENKNAEPKTSSGEVEAVKAPQTKGKK